MPRDVAAIAAVAPAACGQKSLGRGVGDGERRKKPFIDDDVGEVPADDAFGTLKFDVIRGDDVLVDCSVSSILVQ